MRGMDYPFRPVEYWGEGSGELRAMAFRGKKHGACAAAANLNDEGAVIVAITRGAFSIDGKRARTCS